ncbi:MAG: hypothetical protein R3C32_00820 [Chloroflexota bacterium]
MAADLGVAESTIRAPHRAAHQAGRAPGGGRDRPLRLGYDQMAMVGTSAANDRLLTVADEVAALPR